WLDLSRQPAEPVQTSQRSGWKSCQTSPQRHPRCILAKVAGMRWVGGSSGGHAHPPPPLVWGPGEAVAVRLGPCTEEGSMGVLDLLLGRRRGPRPQPPPHSVPLTVERLEARELLAAVPVLLAGEVKHLLIRAAAASAGRDAIIAVVDRMGDILGVRVEFGVQAQITSNPVNLVFAIDGAVAEARTGAFFANANAPLTS